MSRTGAGFWSHRDVKIAYSEDKISIHERAGQRRMDRLGAWNENCTKLVEEYKVDDITITELAKEWWADLEFLADIPPVRELHLILKKPKDLSPIVKLTQLEFLGVVGKVWSADENQGFPKVDFGPLKKLKRASIDICPETESIFECSSLEWLWIDNEREKNLKSPDLSRLSLLKELHCRYCPKLQTIDLSHQPAIEVLRLEACPKLQSVTLHPDTKLRSLIMAVCGGYRIDWERMGRDLESLELSGPLRFPLEDVLKAPNLRRLHTNGIRTFPPLRFLLELPQLDDFFMFNTPGKSKLSEEDKAVVKAINERRHVAKV